MAPADVLVHNHLATNQRVRYRCNGCEVAWTDERDDSCWMCGERGDALRSAFSLREDDYLHLDFE